MYNLIFVCHFLALSEKLYKGKGKPERASTVGAVKSHIVNYIEQVTLI